MRSKTGPRAMRKEQAWEQPKVVDKEVVQVTRMALQARDCQKDLVVAKARARARARGRASPSPSPRARAKAKARGVFIGFIYVFIGVI